MGYIQWMCFLLFALGVALGVCVSCLIFYGKYHIGTLMVDQNDPEKDIYRMNFSIGDLDELTKRKWVLLKVDSKANLTQK